MLINLQRRTLKKLWKNASFGSRFVGFSRLFSFVGFPVRQRLIPCIRRGIHGKPRSRRFQRGNSFCDFCLGRLVLLETAPNFSTGLKRVGASAKKRRASKPSFGKHFPQKSNIRRNCRRGENCLLRRTDFQRTPAFQRLADCQFIRKLQSAPNRKPVR